MSNLFPGEEGVVSNIPGVRNATVNSNIYFVEQQKRVCIVICIPNYRGLYRGRYRGTGVVKRETGDKE